MKFEVKASSYGKNFCNVIITAKVGTGEIKWLKNIDIAMAKNNFSFSNFGNFSAIHTDKTYIEAIKAIYTEVKAEMVEALKANKIREEASRQFDNIADTGNFDTTYELLSWGDYDRFNADYTIADLVARMKYEVEALTYREEYRQWAYRAKKFIEKWEKYCKENSIVCVIPCHCDNYGEAMEKPVKAEEAEEAEKIINGKKAVKVDYWEMYRTMTDFNKKYGRDYKNLIEAVIVYKQSNFSEEYSEESRSYLINNNNHHFDNKISNALWGSCLDGTDQNVRLDYYNWDIEKVYLLKEI